ncbi:caspase domain-containing protein [Paraburkholderia unamae]|nr:caspase domain-containing protein [Paraburkholderia unamae]
MHPASFADSAWGTVITRRRFIGALPVLPSLFASATSRAGSDAASRVALVIGNSHYPHMALRNPGNDAQAMAGLLSKAGFHVDTQLDANRDTCLSAIQQFGQSLSNADVKLAIFYYAGHGAQLDWHNYLIPVDAHVSTGDELRSRCVDLGALLDAFAKAKGKTYVVILDACRNDPFNGTYRPAQAGLSQFDAPVGSLLAYATSPGSVAYDGDANNGLYTGSLVRELSRTATRIEDAFKRVRLNVQLMSNGGQIPWESTSLENDVYIFENDAKPLTDAEIEVITRDDLDTWMRIKSSRNPDDWVAYLRKFPDGRFAEIAQMRLTRLLAASRGHQAATAAASMAVTPAPASSALVSSDADEEGATTIEVASGDTLANLNRPSANPFSAGRYPLGRHFTVDDEAIFLVSDLLTGLPKRRYRVRITKVDLDADRVEGNDGRWVWDSMGNVIASPHGGVNDVPAQLAPTEIQIGKQWTAAWHADHPEYGQQFISLDLKIVAREPITAAQQTFNAFRIEGSGWIEIYEGVGRRSVSAERKYWIVPGINFPLRIELVNRPTGRSRSYRAGGGGHRRERQDLVMLRQHAVDVTEGA